MRTTHTTLGASGAGSWIPIDARMGEGFGLAIGCTITSGASLTYKVQYTFDNLGRKQDCNISRTTTTATVTLKDHGISSTSDSVIILNSGDSNLDGTYAVASIVDADSFTYTVANSGATASKSSCKAVIIRVFDHPLITAITANTDSNLAFPVTGVRLNITAYTSGKVTMTLNQGRK